MSEKNCATCSTLGGDHPLHGMDEAHAQGPRVLTFFLHCGASLAAKVNDGVSSDRAFRGDATRYNPEELLVGSLSACHMLWYLHLCSLNHVTVLEYRDVPSGVLEEDADGSGAFVQGLLKPMVKISAGDDRVKAIALHSEAHRCCFIANSVKSLVEVSPEVVEEPAPD